jgi:glutamate synthase (NADPH/NADH) small chain
MDYAGKHQILPRMNASPTGRRIAVIGAGPAGLSCAGELARQGHSVTVFEKRSLPGGLSTYGIIVLREPMEIALEEARMLQAMGVEIVCERELGVNLDIADLQRDFDAVVLSVGLGKTPALGIEGEQAIIDGLEFIEASKTGPGQLKIGQNVLVVGAGNTAIDCATIASRLGNGRVTMVYRRTEREMTCYHHEYQFALGEGIEFRFLTQPSRVLLDGQQPTGLECRRVELGAPDHSGRPAPRAVAGSEFVLEADQIIKAVGQQKPSVAALLGLTVSKGFIAVGSGFETSLAGVYAIGDCVRSKGAASTVMAVQDGKLAAASIGRRMKAQNLKPEAV